MNKRTTILAVLIMLSSTFSKQGCERPKDDDNSNSNGSSYGYGYGN